MAGVSAADFSTTILGDLGRTVSYQVVTRSTDAVTGEETTSYAAAANKTVVFFLEKNRWQWDKEGLLDAGDAYIIATPSEGIKRYDKFSIDGQEYVIDSVTNRDIVGVNMLDYGVCFKVDNV